MNQLFVELQYLLIFLSNVLQQLGLLYLSLFT